MFGILAQLSSDGRTILLVEQNARSGLAIAHHGAVLDAGIVRLAAPASELLNSPDVARLYLGAS
jgi:branched-chain amino acid transport system ATP-binding protein